MAELDKQSWRDKAERGAVQFKKAAVEELEDGGEEEEEEA